MYTLLVNEIFYKKTRI